MGNEITVKLKCRIKEISKILENKNFKIIEKFYLHDRYFIPKTLNLNNLTSREILSKAILLRNFDEEIPNKKQYKLTFKRKQIDKNGTILKQDKVECEILKGFGTIAMVSHLIMFLHSRLLQCYTYDLAWGPVMLCLS